ncbi:MAG: transcription-repair coupling factor [Acidobacteria bacterium]|nr:transcription-repair coupling factor [Acidobacteriota bacterium]
MAPDRNVSLTLRALFRQAADGAALGRGASTGESISGLTPPAQAFAATVFAGGGSVVLVVPRDRDIESMTSDARFFLAALDGLTREDAARAVLPFPSPEVDPYRGIAPHLDVASSRARALVALARRDARVVVASAAALLPRLSPPPRLTQSVAELRVGGVCDPIELVDRLAGAGFMRADPVEAHGEYCGRGGVVDVFPAGEEYPIRAEFAGDSVESIRRFDPSTQRSVSTLDQVLVRPLIDQLDRDLDGVGTVDGDGEIAPAPDRSATFADYVHAADARFVVTSPEESMDHLRESVAQLRTARVGAAERGDPAPLPETLAVNDGEAIGWFDGAATIDPLDVEAGARHVACQPALGFRNHLHEWLDDVRRGRERGDRLLFVAETAGRAERIIELLAEHDLVGVQVEGAETTAPATVLVATGQLSRGFRLPGAHLQIYAESDLFDDEHLVRHQKKSAARSFLTGFRDLKAGDPVVHVDHGVGAFVGLRHLGTGPGRAAQEFVELRYAGDDKLFVPVEQLDLLEKYTGAANASLDKLGGTSWQKAKKRVRKSMRDMAQELLKLYAARKALPGHAFGPDTHWQREFEAAFEYELTPDQQSALADIKRDMEAPGTMDRLLCGDVGYGKTEVALRAAFKALMDGKQVALLTATTVLAFQHAETIRERFAAFPIRVAMLSRFVGRAEQKQTLSDLAAGKVDFVVGTHRLLSKDVRFRDFGLLVVDEEQRFGVAHKERIKQLRRRVDVLTLTATPIPRTLNMSLAGIRDLSVIETPPKDRLAIQTNVIRFDGDLIARAIRTELARGGQIYLVHNRVESIAAVANRVRRLVPEARLAVAHGQTDEATLERVMIDFVAHRYDILIATTIIENGIDIPNVNTIIINRAERYGLAQLYQLRGRVGRSDRRAYAYLVVPPKDQLSPVARKRLAAIREFSELGSGFRIAALDLEIRGAGNLLGAEQTGHIEAIGFDLYVKLLEQTVRELQGEKVAEERLARVHLGVDLRIDERYIPESDQRLAVYRKVAAATGEAALATALDEVADRYGPVHPTIDRLAAYGRTRIAADRIGVEAIDRDGSQLMIRFRGDAPLDAARMVEFVSSRPGIALSPSGLLRLDLEGELVSASEAGQPPTRAATAATRRDLALLARVNHLLDGLSALNLG